MQIIALTLVLFSSSAWANLYLHVQEDVNVYSRPDIEARRIKQLHYGDRVPISKKDYEGFRKVKVTFKGRRRVGFIRRIDLKHSEIRSRFPLGERRGLGVALAGSYLRQGDREIETTGGTYEISAFGGTDFFLQMYYEWPLKKTMQGRLFFTLRKATLEGDAKLQGGTTTTTFEFKEEFFGGGLLLKKYFESRQLAWAGGSVEYADGQSVEVNVLNGTPLSDDEASPPKFLILSAHLGYDWPLNRNHYLVSEGRVGAVMTTDPFTILSELVFSYVYAF